MRIISTHHWHNKENPSSFGNVIESFVKMKQASWEENRADPDSILFIVCQTFREKGRRTVMEPVLCEFHTRRTGSVTRRSSRHQIASAIIVLLWHACFELLETRDRAGISSFRFNCRFNPFPRKDFETFYKYFYVPCEEIE